MSKTSRAYCERRITAIDRQLAERRPHAGPIWPEETSEGIRFGGYIGYLAGTASNVDDLLEQRAKWMALLEQQS